MKKVVTILSIILAIFMIEGGIEKFSGSKVDTGITISKIKKYNLNEHEGIIQKILFISGMKQTGYLWELIGLSEILFGLMITIQRTRILGAMLLLPVTLNILLFHVFLEPDEILSLLHVVLLFLINLIIIFSNRNKIKSLFS
tara:strand:+ start:71 stop:496 length:426 start_codon:yes stop_codon:yes gene_type:complete